MERTPERTRAPRLLQQPGAPKEKTQKPQFSAKSTATEAQIARLLEMLRLAPRHTHELRRSGISHPAGRVLDLTKRGYLIASERVTTVDSDGFTHVRVARYSLVSEPAPH